VRNTSALVASQIYELIDHGNHDRTSYDVADGRREEISEKEIAPRQSRKIGCCFADRDLKAIADIVGVSERA
jgi:hypothetical protein